MSRPPPRCPSLLPPQQNVTGVLLTSSRYFMLTELAVSAGPCVEWAAVDMGAVQPVGVLRFRYWSPDSAAADLHVSADGIAWTPIRVRGGTAEGMRKRRGAQGVRYQNFKNKLRSCMVSAACDASLVSSVHMHAQTGLDPSQLSTLEIYLPSVMQVGWVCWAGVVRGSCGVRS